MPGPMILADSKSQEYDQTNPFPVDDPWIIHAIRQVYNSDGAAISVTQQKGSLLKFGENESVGTTEAEVMTFDGSEIIEALPTTNSITHISSTNAGDAVAVQVQGHTISGTTLTPITQTITLAGQTKTALATPVARVQCMKNVGATDLLGDVHVYEDVAVSGGKPSDSSKNHCIMPAVENQTLKAKSSTGDGEYLLITKLYASVNERGTAYGTFRLKIREPGGVFQTKYKLTGHSQGGLLDLALAPYFVVKPNSDIVITCVADGGNTSVASGYNGVQAKVTSFPQAGTRPGGLASGGRGE